MRRMHVIEAFRPQNANSTRENSPGPTLTPHSVKMFHFDRMFHFVRFEVSKHEFDAGEFVMSDINASFGQIVPF